MYYVSLHVLHVLLVSLICTSFDNLKTAFSPLTAHYLILTVASVHLLNICVDIIYWYVIFIAVDVLRTPLCPLRPHSVVHFFASRIAFGSHYSALANTKYRYTVYIQMSAHSTRVETSIEPLEGQTKWYSIWQNSLLNIFKATYHNIWFTQFVWWTQSMIC